MKQATKKKEFKKPSFDEIRAIAGFKNNDKEATLESNAEKPMGFIVMPKAFEEAIKLPGIPEGYLSIVTGWSNTGKSTMKNCLIASAQRAGILPVIFETENNFDWEYAKDCGMEFTEVLGDVTDIDTGEIKENQVINHNGFFLYYNNTILADHYGLNDYSTGKQVSEKNKRKQAVLEDIAYAINDLLDKQDSGDLPFPMLFIWDSIGSIGSFKSYTSKTGNNMFDAGAISQAFNNIINNRIPSSRSVSSPYTNTFFCVNKIWNDSMNAVGGAASIELKGGKTFYYGARLIIHVGGVAKASTKALKATAKGINYQYGTVTKVRVAKNQLPTPYNITYEGTMACVHNGLISEAALDDYKKNEVKLILEKIESQRSEEDKTAVGVEDIKFTEEETDTES